MLYPTIRAFALAAGLFLVPLSAQADEMKHGGMKHGGMEHAGASVQAMNVWSRATAPSAKTGAVFLELMNAGDTPDLLVAAASDIADKVELHTHLMEDGVMRMRAVEAFEVAPGAPTVLQPGGNHIMLIGLRRPLTQGESFPVTLTFRDAGTVEVEVSIGPAAARSHGGGHGDHGGHGGHGGHGHGSHGGS